MRPSALREVTAPPLRPETGLVAVLGALGPADLDALLAGRRTGGRAVLLDTATWRNAAQRDPATRDPTQRGSPHRDPAQRDAAGRSAEVATAASTLRRAGWQVALATAGSSAATVWAELTRTDPRAVVR